MKCVWHGICLAIIKKMLKTKLSVTYFVLITIFASIIK
nr:MAG TPA: hypothetical protein [Caudoviricetes sp.]